MNATVAANGRIVIPAWVRRKLGIKAGTRIHILVDDTNHRIVLTPITREYINRLRGKYKGRGLLQALVAGKKRE